MEGSGPQPDLLCDVGDGVTGQPGARLSPGVIGLKRRLGVFLSGRTRGVEAHDLPGLGQAGVPSIADRPQTHLVGSVQVDEGGQGPEVLGLGEDPHGAGGASDRVEVEVADQDGLPLGGEGDRGVATRGRVALPLPSVVCSRVAAAFTNGVAILRFDGYVGLDGRGEGEGWGEEDAHGVSFSAVNAKTRISE